MHTFNRYNIRRALLLLLLTQHCTSNNASEWIKMKQWVFGNPPSNSNYWETYHDPWLASEDFLTKGEAPLRGDFVETSLEPGRNKIAPIEYTPDFRVPEPPWVATRTYKHKEYNRPIRFIPWVGSSWSESGSYEWENMRNYLCVGVLVYKKLTVVGTVSRITRRHALTTATATETVLKKYRARSTLRNILGIWYHYESSNTNNSKYWDIARIHYHPKWNGLAGTNRSHPLPCVFDLAVLTLYSTEDTPYICRRGGSTQWNYGYGIPLIKQDEVTLLGYQFIWDVNRRPTPWAGYAVRTTYNTISNCPTGDRWGWFYCICSSAFGRLGFDSGGVLWLNNKSNNRDKRVPELGGMIGTCSFSMKLRSSRVCHYFTVLDRHSVLDFLYNAYMGYEKYQYLDSGFLDTKHGHPEKKPR